MSPREVLLLGLLISAPLTFALIVALLRGYAISLTLRRERGGGDRRDRP